MKIRLNGNDYELDDPATVAGLLGRLDLGEARVAVAVNREVVPRARHAEHRLVEGDDVEIIRAVAGG